jgi:DNA-binding transcriptional ArsR family regulator
VGADGPGPRGAHDLRGRTRLKPARSKPAVVEKLTPLEKLDALDQVIAAIAHPARRQILLTLHFRGGTATAGELAARFEHAWPTTTRHLRVLEDAGLLEHEKVGRTRQYRLARERLALVGEWLAWFET